MKLRDWAVCQGPNIAALQPCATLTVEEEPPDHADITAAIRATARSLLNDMARDMPGRPATGAPPLPLFQADSAAGFVVEAALALQGLFACPVHWSSVRRMDDHSLKLAFAIMRPGAVQEIAVCALLLLDAARGAAPAEPLARAFAGMRTAMSMRLRHFILDDRRRTAARLGIEHCTGYGMHYTHIRLGHGPHTRLLAPGYTDDTAYLSRDIAGDKNETYNTLVSAGLPVAGQLLAGSEREAVAAARKIGFPVVLKPLRGNRGRGVAVNLGDEAVVREAFRGAVEINEWVVVEKHLQGEDYRLLVVGGKMIAALRRPAPGVMGDGVATVRELIDRANTDGGRDDIFLDRFTVDAEVTRTLADQGESLDTVPPAGRHVLVRRAATPESMVIDVTDAVHPDNRAAAVLAAHACGLDVAGIDFMSRDIAASWRENGGGIVEVNAGPGVDLHMYPQSGRPRDISFHMIRCRVPAQTAGRLPTVMVTGRYGKRATTQWIVNVLACLGYRPGSINAAGAAPRSHSYEKEAAASIVALLADKNIGAGVFDISLRELAREGVPIHYPGVTVLTDDETSALGDGHRPDTLSRTHALTVAVACAATIIDGRKPALRAAAGQRPAWQVGYIWTGGEDRDVAPLEAHLAAGGWAVSAATDDEGRSWIVLRQAGARHPIVRLDDLPRADASAQDAPAALFACAVALALGTSIDTLAAAVRAAAYRSDQASTLMANPFPAPPVAACDPRDALGLRRLALLAGAAHAAGRRLWLVLNANAWTAAALEEPLRQLESPRTTWCCVGVDSVRLSSQLLAAGVSPGRMVSLSSTERARETLLSQADRADLVALIDMDASERLRWCPLNAAQRPAPMTGHNNAATARWQAAELAQHFAGAWVSGPASGWGVDAVAYDHEEHITGKLVAVPGAPDQPELVAGIENRIRTAFERGASAVVAPLLPIDLPRWLPVLVCDDVECGMERLARGRRPCR